MNETINALITRKSCKSYTGEHIKKEEIDLIIQAGLNAPSGLNKQTPIFVATQNEETVKTLSELNAKAGGMSIDPFYGAKDIIVVLVKKEGTYIYDGSLAMGNLLNAAWSLGVDCCWIHRAKEVFEGAEGKKLLEQWGIYDDVEGIGFCILGHKKEERQKGEIKNNRVYFI